MKILYWNVRGLGNLDTRLVIKKLCLTHKPDILFLSEPMIPLEQVRTGFWKYLKLKVIAVNNRGNLLPNIWCLCADHVSLNVISISGQHLSCSINVDNQVIYISAIYASTSYSTRRQLWNELTSLHHTYQGPWCFIGDYNTILGAHEQRGTHLPLRISCDEFRNWTDSGNLTHLMTRGAQFTWSNGRRGAAYTAKRLDRAISNNDWLDFWSVVSCCTLTKSKSDHFPLLINLQKETWRHSLSFKFLRMWAENPDCRKVISEVWSMNVVGCPMLVLTSKLKVLKQKLRDWNQDVFGNVRENVNVALQKVDWVQEQIDSLGPLDDLIEQEKEALSNMQNALFQQEEFWLEKSRLNWQIHGDRNTAFFHRLTKIRNVSKQISMLRNGEEILLSPSDIETHVVSFYEELFSSPNTCIDNGLIEEVIPDMVSAEDNLKLTNLPSSEEIKNAVFSMNRDSAPRPDGFGAFFFQKFWDIVEKDVYNAVMQFF